jgi:enoyl-CoA hydratase/carnithine racemase
MNKMQGAPSAAAQHAYVKIARPEPGIAHVILARPETRNALCLALLHELTIVIREIGRDASVSAVIVSSEGPVFCSGHDLKEMTAHRTGKDGGRAFFTETMTACSAMMQAIVTCTKPVIAAVQGVATAAGCQLVATCDLAVASEGASFATPGVHIGLFCSTPMVALSRNMSRKHAMEMLLLGEMLSADKAEQFGLVNKVVPIDRLYDEALAMARIIAVKSKAAIALGKAAFYQQAEMPLHEAYSYATKVMVQNMMMSDANEGICAFLEKREPQWKDR